MVLTENDPDARALAAALAQGLQVLGCGRSEVRIDYRFSGGDAERMQSLAKELVELRPDAAAAPDEPTAAAPASPSTEETMSQQLGARGNDRDQHQLLECLRCNFIAHMLSDVHAEHDWQHRSRRD